MCSVEKYVLVRQKAEPHIHHASRCLGSRRSSRRLFRDGVARFVVAIQRDKGAELHASRTQLHVCISIESARLNAKIGNSAYAEGQCLRYDHVLVTPARVRIATPVTGGAPEPGDMSEISRGSFARKY